VPADEALEAGAVGLLDPHRSIDAEPTGSLPREHIEGIGLIEQPVGAEGSEDATLHDALEPAPVLGPQERGFVEERLSVLGSGEDAVEDDEVEVGMGVEGGAGPTLRVGARCRKLTAPSWASGGAAA